MKRIIIIIIFIVAIVSLNYNSFGQNKYVTIGNIALGNKQYALAADYYTKALNKFEGKRNERNELVLSLADCYRLINNQPKAELFYSGLVKNKFANEKPIVYLYYANVLSIQGKYPDALIAFNQYLAMVPGDPLALNGKASCELGLRDTAKVPNLIIKNIAEINSPFDDFAAVYGDNQFNTIIFSSNKKESTGKDFDYWTNGYFSDLFISSEKNGGTYDTPVLLDNLEIINTNSNEGTACLDYQFQKIYFTRCAKIQKGTEFCQILEATRMGNSWTKPIVIFKDSLGNVGQPAISDNGLTLIFASNRPGGIGGQDLLKTTRSSILKPFGPAKNMGAIINTSGDEMFPTIFADSILYFASNGKIGFGGLDIYQITLEKNKSSKLEHLSKPINSSADDFAISFKGDMQSGLFTSRRDGGKGGDDIYYFEIIQQKVSILGSVIDELTQKPITQLPIRATSIKGDTITSITDNSGNFLFTNEQIKKENNYTLIVSKENYFTKKKDVNIGKINKDTVYHTNIVLQPIPDKPIVLPDIYYELNKWDLLQQYQDSLMLLVRILKDNPAIVIELASHTDSRASTEYNDTLSLKRAETVVAFLTDKGINKTRLMAKGYGERMPRILSSNMTISGFTFLSGTKLTDEYILSISDLKKREVAYQLNRRTEFSVIRKSFK